MGIGGGFVRQGTNEYLFPRLVLAFDWFGGEKTLHPLLEKRNCAELSRNRSPLYVKTGSKSKKRPPGRITRPIERAYFSTRFTIYDYRCVENFFWPIDKFGCVFWPNTALFTIVNKFTRVRFSSGTKSPRSIRIALSINSLTSFSSDELF